MGDLRSPTLIYAKGVLFLLLGMLAAALLVLQAPRLTIVLLLVLAIWAFCRFYYFAFYVIEHYVDDEFRFAGLLAFVRYLVRRRLPERGHD